MRGLGDHRQPTAGDALVDELGGLDRALAIAKERAKIPADSGVELVTYPRPKSFYEMVSQGFSGNSEAVMRAWTSAGSSNVSRRARPSMQ